MSHIRHSVHSGSHSTPGFCVTAVCAAPAADVPFEEAAPKKKDKKKKDMGDLFAALEADAEGAQPSNGPLAKRDHA